MPDDRSEIVEIFDLESGPAGAAPDEISQGRDRPPLVIMGRWPWWRRTDTVTHILAAVGVAAFTVAVIAGHGALTARPGTQFFVDQQTRAAVPVTVDALGCPATSTCTLVAVPTSILTAVRRVVPSARVTYAWQSVDARSGQVFRREINLATTQTTMQIVSECVPGSGPVPARAMTLTVDTGSGPQFKTANDPTPTGRKRLTQVLPGAPGCSLATEADTTLKDYRLDNQSVDELLVMIAANPALMVTR